MLISRPIFPCTLACLVLLSACVSVDKPASKTVVAQPAQSARAATTAARHGSTKPTPFADDEASRTVFFSFGETTIIDNNGAGVLRQNAQKLKEDPQLVVTLVGHTDNLGSAAYNLAVADKRTEAVSDKLRALGVPRAQIRRLPVGSEQSSKNKCDSEVCRASMRRVELVYDRR